jgi:peptide deformylase
MKIKVVRNRDYLHRKTTPVTSIEEGEAIAKQLLEFLDEIKIGIGLSAIQIGIPKSVSVVKAKKDSSPIILMNPVITEKSVERIVYLEGCLSVPGKNIPTLRHQKVTVATLNHANPMVYQPDAIPVTKDSVLGDFGLLECICVQHEIDHCNGIIITDAAVRFIPTPKTVIKHGRNDKVMIEKDGATQYLKYKKALELVSDGWKVI